ncbi:GMC family oxidoreductase [Paracoccus lutimaris]|uniref:Gluconate 2-dehydrogenase alpha chain n=1 Tax=Paracoccus lutimaris TaxID=1490030 RepID=A0A368Z6G5_9RHOB|nr:GMC family oxidoreductase [Paracoccus lutimaris]RCW87096.1 gluconate 2-dehydrogenase alpha chain [Paracoccus lutimaris]
MRRLPKKDIVIVGLGWAGSIVARQLAETGLDILCLERGPWRDTARDFNISTVTDELRFDKRQALMVQPAQAGITVRNTVSETALPMRQWGSFHPGNGVGGAGLHWAGITWRFTPEIFRQRSHLVERYGESAIPAELTVQDWGLTYDELEPHYDAFDKLAGVSGRAGNLKGEIREGGNPFEGPRQNDYPLPPMVQTHGPKLFAKAAAELGYHPFPSPSALPSEPYTNSLGLKMGPCTYCGFCTNYGCANYSKASALICVVPWLLLQPNIEIRVNSEVVRIEKDGTGRRATGVVYLDGAGEELFQPADLVAVCGFQLENVRLMLLSGVGQPYDPATGTGVTGRNYAYQTPNSVTGFFENVAFNPFIGSGAAGGALDDLNNDNFDHAGLGFFGGGSTRVIPIGGAPISQRHVPSGTPRWGAKWKEETTRWYQATMSVGCEASSFSTPGNYLSLDPTYKDRIGRPLLRMTFDWPENDRRMSQHVVSKCTDIVRAMGAKHWEPAPIKGAWNTSPYQSSHVVGGFVMGADPSTSATNKYLQSWDVPNLFVVGAQAFPQNPGYNPTGTVCALAGWAGAAIRDLYLKSPGPLAPT